MSDPAPAQLTLPVVIEDAMNKIAAILGYTDRADPRIGRDIEKIKALKQRAYAHSTHYGEPREAHRRENAAKWAQTRSKKVYL